MTPERDTEDARPDPVEEAGETTAASLITGKVDTRPVGEGTLVNVEEENDDNAGEAKREED